MNKVGIFFFLFPIFSYAMQKIALPSYVRCHVQRQGIEAVAVGFVLDQGFTVDHVLRGLAEKNPPVHFDFEQLKKNKYYTKITLQFIVCREKERIVFKKEDIQALSTTFLQTILTKFIQEKILKNNNEDAVTQEELQVSASWNLWFQKGKKI